MTPRKFTITTLIASVALFGGLGAIQAQEGAVMALPDTEIGKYAGFAKLESNLAEVTAGTLLLKMLAGDDATAAMDVDDPADDIAAAEGYVAALEAMDLTEAERASLDSFKSGWGELMTLREEMIAGDELQTESVASYWEKANELDELVDDVLTAMLPEDPAIN